MRNARVQDACLLGSDHRLILAIDRFEALLGDAKRPTGAAEPKQYSDSDLGSDRCSQLLANGGRGMISTMGRDRTTSDPFAMATSPGSIPAHEEGFARARAAACPA